MPYYNQEFRSSDLNSPPLSGQAGSGIVVLNACLKDGYNFSVTITGITRSGSTATATVSAADGLKLKTGQILTISGATQTDYNITATITVASTTTFTYTVANSPTTPATGSPVATSKLPITSITRGGTGNLTATATLPNINTTLIPGDKVVVSGCTGTGAAQYNITATLLTVTQTGTTTVVTYLMASDPGASASGSPTYYKAGLQWTHAAAGGTNSQSYVSAATTGALSESYTPRPLQVVDNAATAGGAKEMQIWAYESITSDQNGTNRFPTTAQATNGLCVRKSTAASSVTRSWTLFGDEKSFCFEPIPEQASGTELDMGYGMYFGYFIPDKSGDAYNTIISAVGAFNTTNHTSSGFDYAHHLVNSFARAPVASAAAYIPRLYNQAGTSVMAIFAGGVNTTTFLYMGGTNLINYPNPSNGALYTQRVWIMDAAANVRGRLPGIHSPMAANPLPQWDVCTNNAGLAGVSLRALWIAGSNGAQATFMYDMFGPWN